MGRYIVVGESQVAQTSGLPVTTTVNGYVGAYVAGASANCKIRRITVGVRASVTPVPFQLSLALYRQSVRAAGTGVANAVAQAMDPRGTASVTSGLDTTTAGTIGTTGPTLNANKIGEISFNTQQYIDRPYDYIEELIIDQGTANGLAFVLIGSALPASHLLTLEVEVEE